jgi:superfamily I DNA and RNA helicase
MSDWIWIPSEFLGAAGETGERIIWEAVAKALGGIGQGIGILNYTDFHHQDQIRYQPDILLVSREWGLAVIEVKTCTIEHIAKIQANQWQMLNFYTPQMNPFKQGENQLRQILRRLDRSDNLRKRIPGRVLVALPLITRDDWLQRGFEIDHPSCPPLLFGDRLNRRGILDCLANQAIVLERGESPLNLKDSDWQSIEKVILGHPRSKSVSLKTLQAPRPTPSSKRRTVLDTLNTWMSDIDLQQVKVGIQIPPGPQRIRGIAGSGKTILLCQKAVRMHLSHPDWDIALIFFTRTLYELIPPLMRQWLEYWSEDEIAPDFQNGKLKILHAWGSEETTGFYSLLRNQAGISARVKKPPTGSYPERLAAACKRLLTEASIAQQFDAILIDEGQDLAVGEEGKYEDKQAINWLAWQALRPVEPESKLKRLIWAYDEAQSLDALGVPSYGEVFGEALSPLLCGTQTGPTYQGGINKSEVMKRCYRTPAPILVAAHAIGMGLLRPQGMLRGFTTQADWEKIGYEVTEGSFLSGRRITLHRPPQYSPNPIPKLWGENPFEFQVFRDRNEQLDTLLKKIRANIESEELHPSREILIIVLGPDKESSEQASSGRSGLSSPSIALQRQVANYLHMKGIAYYLPGAPEPNRYPDSNNRNADRFWWDGAITISRMYRAKGHEAPMVYVLGLELVAQDENNLKLRNQLFVALTRSTAWIHLSGIQDPNTLSDYLLYDEMRQVIASENTFKFTFRRPPTQVLTDAE